VNDLVEERLNPSNSLAPPASPAPSTPPLPKEAMSDLTEGEIPDYSGIFEL